MQFFFIKSPVYFLSYKKWRLEKGTVDIDLFWGQHFKKFSEIIFLDSLMNFENAKKSKIGPLYCPVRRQNNSCVFNE